MFCFFIGIVVSYLYATPAGASVVVMNIFTFLLFWAIAGVLKKIAGVKSAEPGKGSA